MVPQRTCVAEHMHPAMPAQPWVAGPVTPHSPRPRTAPGSGGGWGGRGARQPRCVRDASAMRPCCRVPAWPPGAGPLGPRRVLAGPAAAWRGARWLTPPPPPAPVPVRPTAQASSGRLAGGGDGDDGGAVPLLGGSAGCGVAPASHTAQHASVGRHAHMRALWRAGVAVGP